MEEFPVVSLDSLMGGEIIERFKHEFERVVENISDPNTTLDKRSVVMTMTAKPSKSRQQTDVAVKFVTKLAPTESMETTVFISLTKRGLVASEYNPKQPLLPGAEIATGANVTQLRKAGGEV